MNWPAIRKGVALYRAIRLVNRSMECMTLAETQASYGSDYYLGDWERSWETAQSIRGELIEEMDRIFDLDPQTYANMEDAAIGEAA